MGAADILTLFERFVARHDLLQRGEQVVVGVSGGVDSMVLLHLILQYGAHPIVAHVNFRLRGSESDNDAKLVRRFCLERALAVQEVAYDTRDIAAERKESLQVVARELRYGYFEKVARACGAARVAVAHHRDDQVETLLFNLFRGSGLEGLSGMAPRRALSNSIELVRPLLFAWRRDVETYATAEGIPWRKDASNADAKYSRSVIRQMVIPSIASAVGEDAIVNIARASDLIRGYVEDVVRPEVDRHFNQVAHRADPEVWLDLAGLHRMRPTMVRRLVIEALARRFPRAQRSEAVAESIAALLEAQVGARVPLKSVEVWREREYLVFRDAPGEKEAEQELLILPGKEVTINGVRIKTERTDPIPLDERKPSEEFLDYDKLEWPLVVRRWRPGDAFRPLGMDQKVKISDFLTNEKVLAAEKAQVLVVQSGTEIVLVVGHRIAHPYRLTAKTTAALRVTVAIDSASIE